MILGIGTDMVEIARIRQAIERNEAFLHRVFTENELAYAVAGNKIRYPSLAAMWAAKEAFSKASGKGFRDFSPRSVELLHDESGAPYLVLHGNARGYSEGNKVHISLSHTRDMAIGYCIIEKTEEL